MLNEFFKDKVAKKDNNIEINCSGVYYRELNQFLREVVANGTKKIILNNIYGQRYLGTDLNKKIEIEIYGTPGNDLGMFMEGPQIKVFGNAQDGCGNTMNEGEIVVYGRAGDILGMSMRGGEIFVRDNVGYRCAIHMKEYKEKIPVLVIGGTSQDFFGEYMAGGIVIMLGLTLDDDENYKCNFLGTGMHGGRIFLRGSIQQHQLGKEVGIEKPSSEELKMIEENVIKYANYFNRNIKEILNKDFIKLYPKTKRPYGNLYAY